MLTPPCPVSGPDTQSASYARESEKGKSKMKIEFFMPMKNPPTITQQEHKVTVVRGKPVFYEPAELKAARQQLLDLVALHAPEQPMNGPLQLVTKWIWPGKTTEYKTTKPDTDNLIKMLKDCMTRAHFWHDDAQVASEVTEKYYDTGATGIWVQVREL